MEERLGQPVEALSIVRKQLNGLVVRLADYAAHLVVHALPCPLRNLGIAGHGRSLPVLRQDGEEADLLAHPEPPDHVAGELGRLTDVGLRAGRLVAIEDLLGGTPAGGDLDVGEQALLVVVEAVAAWRLEAPSASRTGSWSARSSA
jgi:hypothetical protein